MGSVRRGQLGVDDLRGVAREAFGPRELVSVERLRGGTKKGVYRLRLADGGSGVAYVWHPDEDFWPDAHADAQFPHATGLSLFEDAHDRLSAVGVRVPRVLLREPGGALGDVAVVEDVRGGTLEESIAREPRRAERVLARLGDAVRAMHAHRVDPAQHGVEHVVLRRALTHLAEAAARVDRIADARERLAELLVTRHAAVVPRSRFGLVHGELGPDHVLVDADLDEPVLIDIEGVMPFDVEWEHAFLELRFGPHYRHFATPDLDPARLAFYRLATYLSLVAGPLRLLDGDFPDRAGMLEIVEHNVTRTLAQLPAR
ncbi:phosphotransferase [Saccharothrix sp. S26]|uniref:phosphotransferase family protein n=1 Tax=Saccharothrix sp. S26 TaxID=2907215 RepID=UPI001F15E01F|nr:phosphotransferase [Saccharothrix sp. S26]MCE6997409.1 phosphotransferase [Saccharothrix sp. S26]